MTQRSSSPVSVALPSLLDPRFNRPTLDGQQRDADYPKVKWLDVDGVVHQAAGASNHCLCELVECTLFIGIVEARPWDEPVTCIRCIPEQWRFDDEEGQLPLGGRRRRRASPTSSKRGR